MSRIFQLPRQVPLVSGAVSPGAKANFFLTTTTTPTDTYTDAALTTPSTNPVIADAAGVFATIYLDPDVIYKLTLDDTNDALIYTEDPIQDALTQTNIAKVLFPATASETAAGGTIVDFTKFPTPIRDASRYISDNEGTSDVSAELQAAIDSVGVSGTRKERDILVPSGIYRIDSKITFDENSIVFRGAGRWATEFRAGSGFTGIMFQDGGNPSKIILEDFQISANGEAGVTDLLNLGNVTTQYGTSGYIRGLFLRGDDGDLALNAGTTAFRHSTNVGTFIDIDAQSCNNGIIETANSVATVYHGVSVLGGGATGRSIEVNHATLTGIEIESPADGNVGIYVNRAARINGLTYSQASGVTNAHAIEIDVAALEFEMIGFQHLVTGGSVLTDVIKDNRTAFPATWGDNDAARKVATAVFDGLNIGGNTIRIKDYQLVNVRLRITNTGGTLQHRMTGAGGTAATGNWQAAINGSKAALDDTPTATDSSTAMAFGGKISSVTTHAFIFDTGDTDNINDAVMIGAVICENDTTTVLDASLLISDRNINGTTIERPEVRFFVSGTGAAFALTTGNIGAGTFIDVVVTGFFAV